MDALFIKGTGLRPEEKEKIERLVRQLNSIREKDAVPKLEYRIETGKRKTASRRITEYLRKRMNPKKVAVGVNAVVKKDSIILYPRKKDYGTQRL